MKNIFFVAVAVIIIVLISIPLLFSYTFNQDFFLSFIDVFSATVLFIIFSVGLKYQTKFLPFDSEKVIKFFSVYVFSLLILVLCFLFVSSLIVEKSHLFDLAYIEFFKSTYIWRGMVVFLSLIVVITLFYIQYYYEEYIERTTREKELKNLVTETELAMLKFQINPHFIFNSLNSIAALTHIDSEKAGEMTVKLADFLRSTLSENMKSFNSLDEECSMLERYIDIEKMRFGDKIIFKKYCNQEVMNYKIPHMILQPIVENAVKHAVYDSIEPVTISITAEVKDHFLKLIVKNSLEEEVKPSTKKGVGLENTKKRLNLIYQRDDLLKVETDKSFFEVTIYIPQEDK